jgi:predicted NBD/HSP70 family sugar kinase
MNHYAGLDVSIKETSVCVIDGAGQVVREVKVPTEPEANRPVLCKAIAFASNARVRTIAR